MSSIVTSFPPTSDAASVLVTTMIRNKRRGCSVFALISVNLLNRAFAQTHTRAHHLCECSQQVSSLVFDPPLPFPNQSPYNVDDQDLVRQARAGVGDVRPLRRVLCKAAAGYPLHIVVIGGSVTAGTGCDKGLSSTTKQSSSLSCAWPAVLENWFNTAFPVSKSSVTTQSSKDRVTNRHWVENLSERASSSLVALEIVSPHRKRLSEVDLILIDYAVNDASNTQIKPAFRKRTEDAERVMSSRDLENVSTLTSRYCSSLRGEYRDRLLIATERLVRWSISLPSNPAVLFVETFNPRVGWHKQAQETHAVVANYYAIPIISYRDAVWHHWQQLRRTHPLSLPHADLTSSSSSSSSALSFAGSREDKRQRSECERLGLAPHCAEAFWTTRSLHPPRHVHQLIAHLIAATFIGEHQLGCSLQSMRTSAAAAVAATPAPRISSVGAHTPRAPLFGAPPTDASNSCLTPLSVMSTLATSASHLKPLQPSVQGSAWQLAEDVPGKLGWITYGTTAVSPPLLSSSSSSSSSSDLSLVFDMDFKQGGLTVGFLRSYQDLGRAKLWIEAPDGMEVASRAPTQQNPAILDGLWDEHKSELARVHFSGLGRGRRSVHLQSTCDNGEEPHPQSPSQEPATRELRHGKPRHQKRHDESRGNVDAAALRKQLVATEVAEAHSRVPVFECKFKLLFLMSC